MLKLIENFDYTCRLMLAAACSDALDQRVGHKLVDVIEGFGG